MASIRCFKVLDFDAAFSDHCPILVGVQSLYCHDGTNTSHRKSPKNIKWDDNKKMSFQNKNNTVNKHQFMDHSTELSNQESNMCNIIDEKVTYFSLTLQRAAHFDKAHCSARPSQKRRKHIYDRDCDSLYRVIKHLSRLLSRKPYNTNLRKRCTLPVNYIIKLIRKKHRQFKTNY